MIIFDSGEKFTLNKGLHFTPPSLVVFLNDKYQYLLATRNTRKRAFNLNDVHQYILMGRLPVYFKKNTLNTVNIEALGDKLIELTWL